MDNNKAPPPYSAAPYPPSQHAYYAQTAPLCVQPSPTVVSPPQRSLRCLSRSVDSAASTLSLNCDGCFAMPSQSNSCLICTLYAGFSGVPCSMSCCAAKIGTLSCSLQHFAWAAHLWSCADCGSDAARSSPDVHALPLRKHRWVLLLSH